LRGPAPGPGKKALGILKAGNLIMEHSLVHLHHMALIKDAGSFKA